MKAKLQAVRDQRKQAAAELAQAREELRKVLNMRQEAALVMDGIARLRVNAELGTRNSERQTGKSQSFPLRFFRILASAFPLPRSDDRPPSL